MVEIYGRIYPKIRIRMYEPQTRVYEVVLHWMMKMYHKIRKYIAYSTYKYLETFLTLSDRTCFVTEKFSFSLPKNSAVGQCFSANSMHSQTVLLYNVL